MIGPPTATALSRIVARSNVLRRSIASTSTAPLRGKEAPTPSPPSVVLYDSLTSTFKPVPISSTTGDQSPSTHHGGTESTADRSLGLIWYTCGPTVYDAAHLGHARTYVTLDLIRRSVLAVHRASSPQSDVPPPLFVMNVTDVDDKIMNRAREAGVDPTELARKFEREFWDDMDSLNVLRPDAVTRVSEHVDCTIVPYIERIVGKGLAYVLPDAAGGEGGEDDGSASSVYFDVGAFESAGGGLNKYGKLAPSVAAAAATTEGDFFAWDGSGTNGVDKPRPPPRKRDPRDFVLWKGRKPDETIWWDSPWGPGRPGWHIECSAMIESISETFRPTHRVRVHAGGIDLKFPHHTNEIAQAEAYHSGQSTEQRGGEEEEWIPHWVHTGHLHIRGMKMSKSLKNFVTIRQLLAPDSEDPSSSSTLSSPSDDFRLWCLGLSGSYRGPATYSEARIEEARNVREKFVRLLVDGEEWIRSSCSGDTLPNGKWGSAEVELAELTASCSSSCKRALMGSSKAGGGYDLDGSSYLQALVKLAEGGSTYIAASKEGDSPVEAMRALISTLRENLSLVGFSDRTVKVGIDVRDMGSGKVGGNVEGGERALIEEFINFRSKVRRAALNGMRTRDDLQTDSSMGELLKLCDDVRDVSLPAIGLEILDSKSEEDTGKWRYCIPRKEEANAKDGTANEPKKRAGQSLKNLPVEDLFRVGQYEGVFSKYDSIGLPTHTADGTELSKRLLKKLTKKRGKHVKNNSA